MKNIINKIISFFIRLFSEVKTEVKLSPLKLIKKKSKAERIAEATQIDRNNKALRNQGKRYASTKSFNSSVYGVKQ